MSDIGHSTFLARDVVRLTGLSMSQLARWGEEGLFAPRHASSDRTSAYSRVYLFKDVVGLRTISELRGRHGVSFPVLRRVAKALSEYTQTPRTRNRRRTGHGKRAFRLIALHSAHVQ